MIIFYSQLLNASVILLDAAKQFNYADHCFGEGKYLRSIDEYERFIFFFPDDEKIELALYKIGMSYFKSRQFAKAIDTFARLIDKFVDTELSLESYFMISNCHKKLGKIGLAVTNLNNLIALTDDLQLIDKAYSKIGWIFVDLASWEMARRYFDRISPENQDKYKIKHIFSKLDKAGKISRKKPGLSGFLSIIPGAGHLYCKRYHDALVAFLINTGLIYAAYESFHHNNNGLGGAISLVESGFYTGNIYGAITSAKKYNKYKAKSFITRFKDSIKIGCFKENNNRHVRFSFDFHF